MGLLELLYEGVDLFLVFWRHGRRLFIAKGGEPGARYHEKQGGLYQAGAFNADTASDLPGNFYATRISSRSSWINSVLKGTSAASASSVGAIAGATAVPEPSSAAIFGIGAAFLLRRRR